MRLLREPLLGDEDAAGSVRGRSASMAQGQIKWFDNKKGYGFISIDGMEDIFVHYSNIEGDGFKTLRDGEDVNCEVLQGDKGLYAESVVRLVDDG